MGKEELSHKTVDLIFSLVIVNNKLMVCGGGDFRKLIQKHFLSDKGGGARTGAEHPGRQRGSHPGAPFLLFVITPKPRVE